MTLASGTRLGSYEVVSLLGAGGMGEVYRARDTRLGRDVAVKILPEAFTADADRQARFKREAQLLASLNHPHIAAIYGLEETDGVRALVMELVEGETLADRDAIPLEEALPIARQIAEALEAAHDQGIVHRDLKPANIKVKADGTVKILDFGLAKMLEPEVAQSGMSMSPTLSVHATYAGVILGTAAYMSPEQARGKAVDRRADIWAFGCVLFEMLAGRQAFDAGETVSDAIAAILRTDPDWNRLPADTPAHIRTLLRRCLQKDPQKRLTHIGMARLEIDEGASEPVPTVPSLAVTAAPRPPLWRRGLPALAASMLVGVIAAAAAWTLKPAPSSPRVTRFSIAVPPDQTFTTLTRRMLAFSPDGTQIAYAANSRLYLRTLSESEARPIAGTALADGANVYDPVFSPDGRSIAFWTNVDTSIRKVAVTGGAAVIVCQAAFPFGISWGPGGMTFGQGSQGIMRVAEAGGKPEILVRVKSGEEADSPQILPDGQTVLFTLAPTIGQWDKAQVVAQSLKTGARKTLIEGGSDARFLPTGHLIYALGGVIYSVPFDARRLEVTGESVPVIEGVRRSESFSTGAAQLSVSSTGSLVYVPGPSALTNQSGLALFDRVTGDAISLKLPPGSYEHPRISPDGNQIAFGTDDGRTAIVWVYDLSGATAPRRLPSPGRNKYPIWSGDGQRIVFQSDQEGDLGLFWQRADGSGTPERLTKPEQGVSHTPESWLPNGDLFVFSSTKVAAVTLWTYSVKDRKAAPFGSVQTSYPTNAVFSPDGRWLAYSSSEGSAAAALYVQPFPATGTKYPVSVRQGLQALWSPDGKELFYNPAAGQYVKVDITTSPTFLFSNPVQVPRPFSSGGPNTVRNNDMTGDGKILGVSVAGQSAARPSNVPLEVILNWFEELKARVPVK